MTLRIVRRGGVCAVSALERRQIVVKTPLWRCLQTSDDAVDGQVVESETRWMRRAFGDDRKAPDLRDF